MRKRRASFFLLPAVLALFPLCRANGGWQSRDIDTSVGESALAVEASGNPRVVYHDTASNTLKYARWNGSSWDRQTVDPANAAYSGLSIALGPSEYPHVSYYAGTAAKYAYWNGTSWTVQTIETVGSVSAPTSIAVDASGNAHISYFDYNDIDIRYAKWNGVSWSSRTLDGSGYELSSLALDAAGNPHVALYSFTNYSIVYTSATGSTWTTRTVDTELYFANGCSLALKGSGAPVIAYQDYNDYRLKYAEWTGLAWTTQTVDMDGYYNLFPSLVLDGSDAPHVVYYGASALKYAKNTGSGWTTALVSTASLGGYFTDAAFTPSGNPMAVVGRRLFERNVLPDAPGAVDLSTRATDSLSWSWSDSAGNEDGYRVRKTGSGVLLADLPAGTTAWMQSGLTPNATHQVYIEAYNGSGALQSPSSSVQYTLAQPPSSLALTAVFTSSAALSWSANGNPSNTNYMAERSTDNVVYVAFSTATSLAANPAGLVGETFYYFRVRAQNGNGVFTAYDGPVTTTTLLAIPGSPVVSTRAVDGLTWGWADNSAIETGYRVVNSTSGENLSGDLPANTTFWVQPGLSLNTVYKVQVEAFTPDRTVRTARSYASTEEATLANPPSMTAAVSASSVSVRLAWSANGNPTGTTYEAYRSLNDATYSTISTSISTTTVNATGLSSDTTYFFRVRAKNAGSIVTAYDVTISTMTRMVGPAVSVSTRSTGGVTWSWTDVSAVETGYRVRRSSDNADLSGDLPPDTTIWAQPGLTPNASAQVVVEVFRTGNNGFSAPALGHALANPPGGTSLSLVGSTQAALSWQANGNAGGTTYLVERSSDNVSFFQVLSTAALSAVSGGLVPEAAYYFRVRAQNGDGVLSAYDVSTGAVTLPATASGISTLSIGTGSVAWVWNDNAVSEQGYRVRRSSDNADLSGDLPANTTFWVQTGLSPNQPLQVYVQTLSPGGTADSASSALTYTLAASPSGLSGSAGAYSVDIAWSADGNPAGTVFLVERSTDNVAFVTAAAGTGTSIRVNGLSPQTSYYLRVRARNGSGTLSSLTGEVLAVVTQPAPGGGGGATAGWAARSFSGAVSGSLSLALDAAGNPHVSYGSGSSVIYGRWTGLAWSTVTVDNAGGTIFQTAIALNASGQPHIAFTDQTNSSLKYARPTGVDQWNIDTVDVGLGASGLYVDVVLNASGNAHIAYVRTGPSQLKHADWNGVVWSTRTVSSILYDDAVSIGLDLSEAPHIAFFGPVYALSRAKWNGAGFDVDTAAAVGYKAYPCMAMDAAGNPRIGYRDYGSSTARLARWTGSSWQVETLGPAGFVSDGSSCGIAVGQDGFERMTYYSSGNQLVYAVSYGAGWLTEPVSADTFVGDLVLAPGDRPKLLADGPGNSAKFIQRVSDFPTGVAGVGVSTASVLWNWADNASDEGGYRIRRSTDAADLSGALPAGTTSWQQAGLSPNSAQRVYVEAVTPVGAFRSSDSTQTYSLALAPAGTWVPSVTQSSVTVAWQANGNAPGTVYEAQVSPDGSSFGTFYTGTSLFATAGSLSSEATYYVRVRSLNGNGLPSGYDAVVSTATSAVPPALPSNVQASTRGADSILWSWTDMADNELGYRVALVNGFLAVDVSGDLPPGTQSWPHAGLTPNTSYQVLIQVFHDRAAGSAASPVVYTLPRVPSGTAVVGVTTGSVSLAWSGADNPAGTAYLVERSTDGSSFVQAVSVVSTAAVIGGLNTATFYSFRVRTQGKDGTLTPYDAAVTTSTVIPTLVTASVQPGVERTLLMMGPSGLVRLTVPAQTFDTSVTVTLQTPLSFPSGGSPAMRLAPTGVGVQLSATRSLQRDRPVSLEVDYRPSDVSGRDERRLVLARWDANRGVWVPLPSSVDPDNDRIVAQVDQLSLVQVMEVVPSASVSSAVISANPFLPAEGHREMVFSNLPEGSKIEVLTIHGRVLRALTADPGGVARWDVRNDSGEPVASGVYYVRLEGTGGKELLKVVVQR